MTQQTAAQSESDSLPLVPASDTLRAAAKRLRMGVEGPRLADELERLADAGECVAAGELVALTAELARLQALINTPHTDDWFEGVRLEAAHQIERWGAEHDAGKEPHDWFWLIGYLAGKALHAAMHGNTEKAKHHTISTAAALLNWFRAITGESDAMRPGIDPPPAGLGDRAHG